MVSTLLCFKMRRGGTSSLYQSAKEYQPKNNKKKVKKGLAFSSNLCYYI